MVFFLFSDILLSSGVGISIIKIEYSEFWFLYSFILQPSDNRHSKYSECSRLLYFLQDGNSIKLHLAI